MLAPGAGLGRGAWAAACTNVGASGGFIAPSGDASGLADTRTFRAAMRRGGVWGLTPGGRYFINGRIAIERPSSGFSCAGAGAQIVMLTGPGGFDLDRYDPGEHFGERHVGLLALGVDRPTLDGLRVSMQPNPGVRVCIPFALRGCSNLRIGRLEYWGFKETWRGLFTLDSCAGGVVCDLYAHDCNPDTDVLPSLQVSAVVLDDNRIAGRNTTGVSFGAVRYSNLLFGPRALARYGPQTDAVTVMSSGWTGASFGLISGEGVGEVLDCWGDGVTARIHARQTQLYPVKLMYGAQRCRITADVDGTGLSAVYLAGTADNPLRRRQGVEHNIIQVTAKNVGALHDSVAAVWRPMPSMQAGVYFDNPGLGHDPADNQVRGSVSAAPGARMPYAVGVSASGPGNVVALAGGGFTRSFANDVRGLRFPPAMRALQAAR